MPTFQPADLVADVLAAPLGEVIASVGRSVAEAQQAMDAQTLDHFRAIYQEGGTALAELRALGYQPTWYHIPEATAEIAIALTVTSSAEGRAAAPARRLGVYAAPVDAGYQSKFSYGVQASSSLKFRVVPVPPPQTATRMRIAPNLVGRSLAQARAMAAELGIELRVAVGGAGDEALVATQEPSAGGILATDTLLWITGLEEKP